MGGLAIVARNTGLALPYGVYDVTANAGIVSVGITSDTAEFAIAPAVEHRTRRNTSGCARTLGV